MLALQAWVLENMRSIFTVAITAGIVQIGKTCAFTAAMYGIKIPFSGLMM